MAVRQAALPARTGRGTQLALTILAALLSVSAYVLVTLGKTGRTPANVGGFVAIIVIGYLVAHLVIVRLAPGADPALFPAAATLAGLGYAMIYRLNTSLAAEQLGWLILGLLVFTVTLVVVRDHRSLDGYTYTIGLIGIGFLLLPIAPGIGETINGARLWVHVGPVTFQPSELGKVLIVIFLASYLASKKDLLAVATRRIGPISFPEPRYLGPLMVAWFVSLAVLFIEKDLGSSLLFFGIFVIMLWAATARGSYLVLGLILFVIGAILGYLAFAHVQDRVTIWFHALQPLYIHDQGYQLAQGEFAMATGGLSGTGLGLGHPQLIPAAATDFIFASIGEELGLLGATAVLLLYVALVGRGFRIALARVDPFSKLLALGLASALGFQTFIIAAGVMRLIPLTGITLPFVSYGGSSVVANFVLLALLIRTSSRPPAHAPLSRRGQRAGPAPGDANPTVAAPVKGEG